MSLSPPDLLPPQSELNEERRQLLEQIEDHLETPMLLLGFVWLGLLVWEFVTPRGLSDPLEMLGTVIWVIFLVDFGVKFALAPDKSDYLQTNWLTAISLLVPALRVFRIVRVFRLLRVARAARGLRFFRLVTSLNRGMRALSGAMGRRGFGYVLALTLIATFAGAAGMFAFERGEDGFQNYGQSLWWTAMLMTTLGSESWPQSSEGRALCFLLSLFAFTIFGYVTATLATFFVGRDAQNAEAEVVGANDVRALRDEIAALREDIRALSSST
ncbi:MAG: ion transporter [Armatimonadetes bacterium]|nr:ion transporter [Armatimonadota bacterium]